MKNKFYYDGEELSEEESQRYLGDVHYTPIPKEVTGEYRIVEFVPNPEVRIAELRAYLAETDYIVTKINEVMIEDSDEAESLKQMYAGEIQARKDARIEINELQKEYGLE